MLRGRQPCEVDHARRWRGTRRGECRGRRENVDCEGEGGEGVMKSAVRQDCWLASEAITST
jgi:hypothetical protein